MKTKPFHRQATGLAIVVAILSGCATAPKSDTVPDQQGQARVAPIGNFHVVDTMESKPMYRGAQPADDAQWAFLSGLGVKTVLKLNEYVGQGSTVEQERQAAEKYGIRVIPAYMQPEDYPRTLNPFAVPADADVKAALKVMEDPANRPLYIHDSHGRDTAGLLVAMYRLRQNNFCKDKAFDEMKQFGHNPLLRPGLRRAFYRDDVGQNSACTK